MPASRKRRFGRRSVPEDLRLPARARLGVFAGGLVVLGAVYGITRSEIAQGVALFAIGYLVLPPLARRYGVHDDYTRAVARLKAPRRVAATVLLCLIPWLTALFFLSGAIDLGALFWLWAALWPSFEVYDALGRRDVRRHGLSKWKPERPARDVTVYSLLTVPLIALISLGLDDVGLVDALLAGVLCGVAVFGLAMAVVWIEHRADRRSGSPR